MQFKEDAEILALVTEILVLVTSWCSPYLLQACWLSWANKSCVSIIACQATIRLCHLQQGVVV